jgi:hypothetical protein
MFFMCFAFFNVNFYLIYILSCLRPMEDPVEDVLCVEVWYVVPPVEIRCVTFIHISQYVFE